MSFLQSIQHDTIAALKKGDTEKVSVLRLLVAALKNDQIARQHELSNEEVFTVVRQLVKQRQESIELYKKAQRLAQADKEQREIAVLMTYLPQEMSDGDLKGIIEQTIEKIQARSMNDFGSVMKAVMGKVKGQASGQRVHELVKHFLHDS